MGHHFMKKTRKKRSVIYSLSRTEFQNLVSSKHTVADILRHFGLHVGAGNYRTFQRRVEIDNIDTSHFYVDRSGTYINHHAVRSLESILVDGSSYSRSWLKLRLIKEGLLRNSCYECGLIPEWNGKELALQLDHINGKSDDNRLENLRLLCPNCHSQTSNFSGKNASTNKKHKCIDCDAMISHKYFRCLSCSNKNKSIKLRNKNTKIEWPPIDTLISMVDRLGYAGTGRVLGVWDNTVRKRIKRYSNVWTNKK